MTQYVSNQEIQAAGGFKKWYEDMLRNPCLSTAKPKQPGKKAQKSEHEEQAELFELFAAHSAEYPELDLAFAIPNGGHRFVAVAAKLKAEGVKAGVPDIFIPAPRESSHGLFIEIKAAGGTVSESQVRMMAGLSRLGYACIVAYGCEKAWIEIKRYLGPLEEL